MSEEVGVGAAGFFESIREDGEASTVQVAGGQLAIVVGGLGER